MARYKFVGNSEDLPPRLPGAFGPYHHPERIGITQPRVASSELPWGKGPTVIYSERVASTSTGDLGGTIKMRPRLPHAGWMTLAIGGAPHPGPLPFRRGEGES